MQSGLYVGLQSGLEGDVMSPASNGWPGTGHRFVQSKVFKGPCRGSEFSNELVG